MIPLSFAFCLKQVIRWLAIAVGHQEWSMVGKKVKQDSQGHKVCGHLCIPVCIYVCENVCKYLQYVHAGKGKYLHMYVSMCPGSYL